MLQRGLFIAPAKYYQRAVLSEGSLCLNLHYHYHSVLLSSSNWPALFLFFYFSKLVMACGHRGQYTWLLWEISQALVEELKALLLRAGPKVELCPSNPMPPSGEKTTVGFICQKVLISLSRSLFLVIEKDNWPEDSVGEPVHSAAILIMSLAAMFCVLSCIREQNWSALCFNIKF